MASEPGKQSTIPDESYNMWESWSWAGGRRRRPV